MSIQTRIAIGAGVVATLACQVGVNAVAQAQSTDLFISEYIEGSSNNKALEIYNGTLGPINLASGGYSIEMYFNASTTPALSQQLAGTVASNDVFVLSHPSAALVGITSVSDQATTSTTWYNGNDTVVLKKNGVVIDAIGQIASNPATEWGAGLTSTADNTLQRKSTICQGDTNPNDTFDPALEWNGFAQDTTTGLGMHTANCSADNAPSVTATAPSDGGTLDAAGSITITWSEPVSVSGAWFTLSCAGSNVSASESGTGSTRTLDPTVNLPAGASCTLTVLASQVFDTDGVPTQMAANYVTQFSVVAGCGGGSITPISAIQGSGTATPVPGSVVEIEGIVVGDFQGSPDGLGGFNVQEELADQDGSALTSEGIFVFDDAGSVPVQVGDIVHVRGTVQEYFSLTELTGVTVTVCSSGAALPAPAAVTLPVATVDTLERWEGMLVAVSGPGGSPLVATESFTDGRYGELTLATSRQWNPTNIELPASAARVALADLNLRSRIELDDGRTRENPTTPVPIPYVGSNGTLRLGDSLTLSNLPAGQRVLTGILNFAFGVYEINPTVAIVPSSWTSNNPRPSAAPNVGGRIKVVTMNALNYFKTLDTATESACASGANCCGPSGTLECRGAQTASELTRQETKLQASMKTLAADLYALQEIENPALSGARASELALASLVSLLNTAPNLPGTYAYITTGSVGGDAIKVGFLYKVATLQPVGVHQILDNSDCATYRDNRNRPSLAQTFREVATGAKFTALVAHLKSKGSSCASDGDALDPNGQGECNGARLAAAQCIRSWLAGDPTASADADYLLLGDMNAYNREDPIAYLESNGYTDIMRRPEFDGPSAYDFVFEGEAGALSHAIANSALFGQLSGARAWHINADEPPAFDYNDFNQSAAYAPDPYRSADHDPLVVGLNLTVPVSGTAVPALDLRWLSLLALTLAGAGLWRTRRGRTPA